MISIAINGLESVLGMLDTESLKIAKGLTRGLAKAGTLVVGEAKAECPVSTEATRPGGPHGELRASIKKQVSGNTCDIGTNVEYAPYVEFGTCKMAAQPFLVPALVNNADEVIQIIGDAVK